MHATLSQAVPRVRLANVPRTLPNISDNFVELNQCDLGCLVLRVKIFLFFRIFTCGLTQITFKFPPSRPTQRGVRDRHGRGAGIRWTRMAPLTKALEADGESVWS
jgi:hypothetical protein